MSNIKQIEIYNDDPFYGKGDFYISVVYEVDTPDIIMIMVIYQANDAGITKIVTAVSIQTGNSLKLKLRDQINIGNQKSIQSNQKEIIVKRKVNNGLELHRYITEKWKRKKSNQLNDFQHKLIQENGQTILKLILLLLVILKLRNMAQSKKHKGKRKQAQEQINPKSRLFFSLHRILDL